MNNVVSIRHGMTNNLSTLQQTILAKKAALAEAIGNPLGGLAERCAAVWPDADALDRLMLQAIPAIPNCQLLYAWDRHNIETSSMVQASGADPSWRGRDLSQRPYLKNHLPFQGIMLSSVYESAYTHVLCVTALQAVRRGDELLGFIAADFAVSDLLRDASLATPPLHWRQYRGDPAVRGTLFLQSRVQSLFDDRMDEALAKIADLMARHGVFHCKLHFSSGRCSFWLYDDPYDYRIHSVEDILDPELCLAFPTRDYPARATVPKDKILPVFRLFKSLRFADETIYLRSSSLNLINGMVGLTFSCDGSHYLPVDEFLNKDARFWIGAGNAA
jgi:hypothetical protein